MNRHSMMSAALAAAGALIMAVMPGSIAAQPNKLQPIPDNTKQIVDQIGLDQRLNAQVPLDLPFVDESGKTVRLSDYVHDKPVVLILAYYRCPMLCTEVLNGALKAMRVLDFNLGDEYRTLTISIDPSETPALAAEKKSTYIQSYNRPGAADGWHFLTGPQTSIDAVAKAVGFRYVYDPNSGQYAHAGGMMLLTPEGRVSRYFYGVEFSPNDLKFGLMEASDNKIGSAVDKVMFLCFHWDPTEGKYSFMVMSVLRIAGVVFLAAVGGSWFVWRRNDRRKRAGTDTGSAPPQA